MPNLPNLLDLPLTGLEELLRSLGEPGFRAKQVFQWLWQKGADDPAAMTNLSKELRGRLAEVARIAAPTVAEAKVSSDGTAKLLLALEDGRHIETVLIPEEDHLTQCLSSQVGCPMACGFCATGTLGFTRNLTVAEFAGQVLATRRWLAEAGDTRLLRNLVVMGMGEPLLNLDNLLDGLAILTNDLGAGFSSRRITVSTCGVPGRMLALGESQLASLAVSLHAPTQELRERIMPGAAKRMPLDQLMVELKAYPLKPRERITIEYLLLDGVNDSPQQARQLVRLLNPLKCKVNLIAYNATPGLPFAAPDPERVLAFQQVLRDAGLTAMLRKSKGADIAAACGQLAAQAEQAVSDSHRHPHATPSV